MSWARFVDRNPRAQRDIVDQVEFYLFEFGGPDVAERFLEALEATLAVLVEQPKIGTPQDGRIAGLRRWHVMGFERHLLFYRPAQGRIELIRVLHAARDLEQIFDS